MSEPAVIRAVRDFKAGIAAHEAAELSVMAGRWARLENTLEGYINNLLRELAEKRAQGIVVADPMQLERYQVLLAQVRIEMAKYTRWAEGRIERERERMVELGVEQAAEAITIARVTADAFNRLPTQAIETMQGMLQQDAPLGKLLAGAWPKSVLGMSQALEDGIALGWGPRETARAMREGLESGLQRVFSIARTEQLRAYRIANNEQYQASGVVQGWKWVCAKNTNTCIACIALDGTEHPLSEVQQDHPNGGCTSAPIVLGEKPTWQTGEDWFKTLSEVDQRKIMGDAKFEAWDGGKGFDFSKLAQTAHSDTWGDSVRVATLGELGKAESVAQQLVLTLETKDGLPELAPIEGITLTDETRQHYRDSHKELSVEVYAQAEEQVLMNAINNPEYVTLDPKNYEVERRYARDSEGKWWRVVVRPISNNETRVITFHRVQKPGR